MLATGKGIAMISPTVNFCCLTDHEHCPSPDFPCRNCIQAEFITEAADTLIFQNSIAIAPSSCLSPKKHISHPPPLISTNPDRVIADVIPGHDWSRSWFHPARTEPEAQFVLHGAAIFYPDHTRSQTTTPTKN
ncbi:hypothetical protein CEXT_763271 [Caerostris extrusa]|uniref:Uncharacterized protein n=1 Tax=Caerostris extrusa TaxID=172846 RepID=A0AAV4XW46_CAEEX|nr:hypothetical protein CEXT_763271 [Caerostris extrusa]